MTHIDLGIHVLIGFVSGLAFFSMVYLLHCIIKERRESVEETAIEETAIDTFDDSEMIFPPDTPLEYHIRARNQRGENCRRTPRGWIRESDYNPLDY